MIDIVYTIKKGGSRSNDKELIYSLRTVEKHLKNYRNVYIIGHKPDFITNVIHIPAEDKNTVPDANILRKLLIACDHPDISESFLFFNDDHYLLQDFDAPNFPYYYCSTLKMYLKRRVNDAYGRRTYNTMTYLMKNQLPTKHFDIHFPIVYDKQKFKECFKKLPETHQGYVLKSLYANILKIQGIEVKDCKHVNPPTEKYIAYSTHPKPKPEVWKFLEGKFPSKSVFEI